MVPELKAFIVEKEGMAGDGLSLMLKKYFPEIDLLGLAKDAKKAMALISSLKPNIIFLDIELKNGSGFQLMEKLCNSSCYFIVMADVEKYALKAISYGVTDYLLKPFSLENMVLALNKVKALMLSDAEGSNKDSDDKEGDSGILALPSADRVDLVKKEDIVYLKADGRYTRFYLVCGTTKIACRNLGEFEKHLDPKFFFRTHHSFIVNIAHVKNINKTAGNYLELKTGSPIPVAKRKLDSLNKFLGIK
ncbi:LytTR family DNA-binding domain-containing protein [Flavobacteriaceae bacterium 3-367]|uniref:LytR/AlgR family response regulator transcription factor n=1 Tax=Eudoraea algarum TaxID=3417568 RepID=UPI003290EEE0